nr:MAG TPA: hypothetical protein [Caudoviricetes sp.]
MKFTNFLQVKSHNLLTIGFLIISVQNCSLNQLSKFDKISEVFL